MDLVIVGYSGHAFSVIDSFQKIESIKGYIDYTPKPINPFNLSYLGNNHITNIDKNDCCHIAIGDNFIRRKLYLEVPNEKINIIDDTSIISKHSFIQEGNCFIGKGSIVNSNTFIDIGVIINSGAIIEHDCRIKSFSHIGPGSILCGAVEIGSNCLIGANCTILPGIKIGDNVTVGAGSIVLNDLKSNTKVAGVPARKL